jgi:hypothetical protein
MGGGNAFRVCDEQRVGMVVRPGSAELEGGVVDRRLRWPILIGTREARDHIVHSPDVFMSFRSLERRSV